ncbi:MULTISPECIES: hypothetical protein [Micromonospora]|uniref:Uncharacterized protein n=1 Tax=Micromonospora yangpuensis TaxID=683228 RepID=A0A1C6VHN3_9ACTN|nr:hypothetical protein [Micromonospora yangpuensis]GGL99680.1 hypothetical protein GCM10012279_16310 [Micromonospora yangpuensis]SCL65727.1 hypothetical protein GA0070617_5848 [Micromonospora yangpuensis]
MGFTTYLALFAVAASATVFVVTRRRLSLAAASGLSALTFLGIAAASILWVQVAISGMDG